jgi:hypothetical protein
MLPAKPIFSTCDRNSRRSKRRRLKAAGRSNPGGGFTSRKDAFDYPALGNWSSRNLFKQLEGQPFGCLVTISLKYLEIEDLVLFGGQVAPPIP